MFLQAETGTADFVNVKGQNMCAVTKPYCGVWCNYINVKHNFATISLSLQFVKYESFRDLLTTLSSNLHQSKFPILGSNGLENVTLPNPFCQHPPEILLFDVRRIRSECLSFNLDLITHLEILLCNYFCTV